MAKAVIDRDGWAKCPVHFTKLGRVDRGGKAKGVKLWCSRCKGEVELDIY
jgi:hypothetical protein